MGVPQGVDLEFSLINLPAHSYNKYLLSICSALGAGDKGIKWQTRHDTSPCGAPWCAGKGSQEGRVLALPLQVSGSVTLGKLYLLQKP